MARRGSHEGTIRQRPKDHLWEARYVGVDGRRRSIYAHSRGDVQEGLRAALRAADSGVMPVGQRLSTATFLADWLDVSVRPRCRPSTCRNYETVVRTYLVPALGRVPLAKLGPEHIERMLAALTARGDLSPTTVRYAYSVLRIALGRALKSGRVTRNACTLVDPPTKATVTLNPLTSDQVALFLNGVEGNRLAALFLVAIGTGLRQGELLALRWQDVDLNSGTLTVRHTLERQSRTLAEPKTPQGRRTLQLAEEVLAALRNHRKQQLAERVAAGSQWQDGGFVFATMLGRPLDTRNVTRAFQTHLWRLGLPRQRFHDLRHAYATLMIEQGEELATISKSLGHADLSTTADVYAHLTPAIQRRAADRMDAVLRRRYEATSGG